MFPDYEILNFFLSLFIWFSLRYVYSCVSLTFKMIILVSSWLSYIFEYQLIWWIIVSHFVGCLFTLHLHPSLFVKSHRHTCVSLSWDLRSYPKYNHSQTMGTELPLPVFYQFQVLHLTIQSILSWHLYVEWGMSLVSLFSMCTAGFIKTLLKRIPVLKYILTPLLNIPWQNEQIYIWAHCSVPLVHESMWVVVAPIDYQSKLFLS